MGAHVHISLLGPVSVRRDGEWEAVRSRPQRIVLACLALQSDRVVRAETLIDALWPDDAPPNAAGNLHSYVSKLRRLLGPDAIRREHGGYRLAVDEDAVDALRIEQLSHAAVQPDPRERAAALADALSLWKGEALTDVRDTLALVPEHTRLATLRRELEIRHLAALVDADDHPLALPGLREASARDPHDELVVALLARALHGTGRTAEALRALSELRRRVAEDTGLEASPEVARLEEQLLVHDPALRTDARHAGDRYATSTTAWPRFATPLHGREHELGRLEQLVGDQRIVTLTGTGGVGKTRLACAITELRSAGGQPAHFLQLGALAPDDDLTAHLAAALRLRVHAGQDPLRAVHERIGGGGQLLVLDNCEHVIDLVRDLVDALVAQRSDLTVLSTSRTPLGLPAECILRIAPFGDASDAGRDLFLERARRVRPGFELGAGDEDSVRAVVRGLGGLPLAIELAAGRMTSMSLDDLAARIDDLDLLTSGRATERHRTLRGAIDWSYQLLSEPSRRLLRMISLFPGGIDLTTVEELAPDLQLSGTGAADTLALADASLIDADLGRSSRYTMLEPVRAFAAEQLRQAGERTSARSLRAGWARRTSAWIEVTSRSPAEAAADARLRSELANLRAAHRTARHEDDLDTAIEISTALMRPATARDLPEVWSWALDLAGHPALLEHEGCSDALGAAATAAWLTGDLGLAERLASQGLALDPDSVASLQALGSVRLFLGDPAAAQRLLLAASRPNGDYLPQAALAAVYEGDVQLAQQRLADADGWAAAVGSPTEVALCRYAWGELLGPEPTALGAYEEAIELASSVGSTFVASISRVGLASTLAADGQHGRALDEFDTVIRYWRTTGNSTQQWTTLRNAAVLLEALDRGSMATRIRDAAAVAPSAAAPAPNETTSTLGAASSPSAGTPEAIVPVVLAQLAELRRDLPAHGA